jgi:hypothetical protein
MKRKIFIESIVFVLLINVSCTCNGQNKKSIVQNDAIIQYFSDTVAAIFASPTKVRAYILSMDRPTEKSQIIGGYVVKKKLGNVPAKNYSILQFLMQDAVNYQADSAGVRKCYFEPYLAFEFVKGRGKVIVLLAFNCESWGIVFNNQLTSKPYLCHRQMLRFAQYLLPNDEYIEKLLTFQNEEK